MSETREEYRQGIYESQRLELLNDKSYKCLLDYAVELDLIPKSLLVELIHESTVSYEEIETWQ